MQKKNIPSYFFILAILLVLMSLSRPTVENIRGHVIAFIAPLWESILYLTTSKESIEQSSQEEIQRLKLENQLLNNELQFAKHLLEDKKALDLSIQSLSPPDVQQLTPNYEKYIERLKNSLALKLHALPAHVIFRSLDLWNRSLWINVGEANNAIEQTKIVSKYSPVVVGNSIIGVIDYVGKHQSRVRLITDPRLIPAVRVARGGEQESLINEYVEFLLNTLQRKKDLLLAETDRQILIRLLNQTKSTLQPSKHSWYLAKGEIQGSIKPSGRFSSRILKGSGFNYDFADEEGESRDLRTGKLANHLQGSALPILKVDDLLVTTGMDGVFPPNLKVATITKIALLKEGDYFYEIEAQPTVKNLNEISLVFVLSPLSYDKDELSLQTKK